MFARREDQIRVAARPRDDTAGESATVPLFDIRNETRGTIIGDSIRRAGASRERRNGLLGCAGLLPGEGLWIVPCEGVHTFGMRFAIDVVFLDRQRRVRKLVESLPSRHVSISLTSHSVIELPAGVIAASGSRVGDRFSVNVARTRGL